MAKKRKTSRQIMAAIRNLEKARRKRRRRRISASKKRAQRRLYSSRTNYRGASGAARYKRDRAKFNKRVNKRRRRR